MNGTPGGRGRETRLLSANPTTASFVRNVEGNGEPRNPLLVFSAFFLFKQHTQLLLAANIESVSASGIWQEPVRKCRTAWPACQGSQENRRGLK